MFFNLCQLNSWHKLTKTSVFFVTVSLGSGLSSYAIAQTNEKNLPAIIFTSVPQKCVALRQGRTCYTTVKLKYHVLEHGYYCVFSSLKKKATRCFDGKKGRVSLPFKSKDKVVYTLVDPKTNTVLASTSVEVAWVHKTETRKRRWRLF